MYRKSKSVHAKSSASLLYNNLSALVMPEKNITTYAIIHKTVVNLGSCTHDSGTISHKQVSCKAPAVTHASSVLQAKFCVFPERNILVLSSQRGVQMFEPDGSAMVFWYALPEPESTQGLLFTRGIAVLPENIVAVGTYLGSILIFKVPSHGTNVILQETVKCHDHPISALATEGAVMASADDSGCINVWEAMQDQIGRVCKINGGGSSCCSVAVYKYTVIGGYGSGHVRIFDAFKGSLLVEVCAHAKWIHAMDLASDVGLLVTTSEDTFVRVWSLVKEKDNIHIQLEHTANVSSSQLTGVQFLDSSGQSFCVSGYDSNELVHYTKT